MSVPIYFLDVFAETPFSGNQLAVVFDAGDLRSEQMQAIAKETNFSETTFLTSREVNKGGYDVRIFTPDTELPFAGHPTLGTAFAIRNFLLDGDGDEVLLNLKIGQIPVRFVDSLQGESTWMQQKEPLFGDGPRRAGIAKVLSLKEDELDQEFEPRLVSTGVPTIVVPLASKEALKSAKVQKEPYRKMLKATGDVLILAYCRGGYDESQELSVRVFCDCFGVVEDPATGSAAGCLAAYVAREKYFGGAAVDIAVGQGYEIGRPSTLYLKAEDNGDSVKVEIGGKVRLVGKGEFFV